MTFLKNKVFVVRYGRGKLIHKSKGETLVCVIVIDNKVAGGISCPSLPKNEKLLGSCWSLEGKTVEEVHPEITKIGYLKWSEKWSNQFK